MSYGVCTVEYLGCLNHIALFVENESAGGGTLFHVIGTILRGMTFEMKRSAPDQSATFIKGSKKFIGRVKEEDMALFEAVCRSIPPPGAQMSLNGKLTDPSKPLRRCGEWVTKARSKLIEDGIVKREYNMHIAATQR